jgi:hypothetical protein
MTRVPSEADERALRVDMVRIAGWMSSVLLRAFPDPVEKHYRPHFSCTHVPCKAGAEELQNASKGQGNPISLQGNRRVRILVLTRL